MSFEAAPGDLKQYKHRATHNRVDIAAVEPGGESQGFLRPAVENAVPAQGAGELLAGGGGGENLDIY